MKGLLTKTQAAARLGITERTIKRWMSLHWLDVRYLGPRMSLITEESVRFWQKLHTDRPKVAELPWNRNGRRKR